jgi:hypothetical protein
MRTLKDSNVFRFGASQGMDSSATKGGPTPFGKIGAHLIS